nr:3',5'-cyclic-nucleotide phosphodiesterase [uncultured Rhodoferax sp.]
MAKVRVLGCSGAIAKDCRTTSFLVGTSVLIDAGTGLGDLTLEEMQQIDHVFLTHSHLDHIAALPLMLDSVGARRTKPLQLYALAPTLQALKTHIFNDVIWPDFTQIPIPAAPFLTLNTIVTGQQITVGNLLIEAMPARHSVPALGYAVSMQGPQWVFSGDTSDSPEFWFRMAQMQVGMLVIETAFSNKEADLARKSYHFAPQLLAEQLKHIPASCTYPIYITHTKPAETELIMKEFEVLQASTSPEDRITHEICWLNAGQEFSL